MRSQQIAKVMPELRQKIADEYNEYRKSVREDDKGQKEKRQADGEVKVNDKGTRMAKAKCPECGTNLNRILGKA